VTEDPSQLWWMFAIRAFISIAFAGICYLLSSVTASMLLRPLGYLYLLFFFSFYIFLSGFVLLVGAVYAFDSRLVNRRLLLVHAILDLVIGPVFLATFGFGRSFVFIVALFGLHAVVIGAFYFVLAIRLAKKRASYALGLAGVWSFLVGAYIILFRSLSPGRLTLLGAYYAVVLGLLLLLFSVDLRITHRELA
jgi:uncharacterized membrane protein HdeD (DUF308 family)